MTSQTSTMFTPDGRILHECDMRPPITKAGLKAFKRLAARDQGPVLDAMREVTVFMKAGLLEARPFDARDIAELRAKLGRRNATEASE